LIIEAENNETEEEIKKVENDPKTEVIKEPL